jgi:hypothetical protein
MVDAADGKVLVYADALTLDTAAVEIYRLKRQLVNCQLCHQNCENGLAVHKVGSNYPIDHVCLSMGAIHSIYPQAQVSATMGPGWTCGEGCGGSKNPGSVWMDVINGCVCILVVRLRSDT